MDEQNIKSSETMPNRPRLKKVKRPIRRLAPQAPTSGQSQVSKESKVSSVSEDSFDISGFGNTESNTADDMNIEEHLPSLIGGHPRLNNHGNAPQHPNFLGMEPKKPSYNPIPSEGFFANGKKISQNMIVLTLLGVFFFGFVMAKVFFGGEKIVKGGLDGVVVNSEIPKGRARCGKTDKTQGCILYIMNPQRQELLARDFYDLASQLTGRQRFVIETGNMRYANRRIKPGEFGQFNIPPLQ